jgi:hypothetical protein
VARKRGGKSSSRNYDVEDLVEFVAALSNIRNGGNGRKEPLLDPSVNVKELVELRASYEKELRIQSETFQAKLDYQKDRANEFALKAEAGRLDALRASDAANVASALVTVTTAATTLATATATQNETTAKAIVALQLIASSSGGTLSGREAQQAQTRSQSNFNLSQWITVGGILLLVAVDLKTKGVI